MSTHLNVNELCVILIVALTLLQLVNKVSNMVASVATGDNVSGSSIGSFGGTAAALKAAAALTGATKAMKGGVGAGKTAVLAAGNAAGGKLTALKAAFNAASQAQQMGTGAFAGMKPNAPGDGSLTRAMYGSPAFCAELATSLASGTGKVAKAKVDSMKRKTGHAIATSTGER